MSNQLPQNSSEAGLRLRPVRQSAFLFRTMSIRGSDVLALEMGSKAARSLGTEMPIISEGSIPVA